MTQHKKTFISLFLSVLMVITYIPGIAYGEDSKELYPEAPDIYGKTAILMDADTGAVLYDKDSHRQMYPASITKIMTALLAIERCAMDDTFTFNDQIINGLPYDAAKYGYVSGEQVVIEDLLYVLLLRSANEVAVGLGMHMAGTEEEFGKMMTQRAKEAGAVDTNFVNATGLHDDNHYTTAYDMALITREAINNATFEKVWGSANYIVAPTNLNGEEVRIWNRHEMLVNTKANYYEFAIGGKTGYTDQAGRTLVTYASKDGMNLISVVMFSDTEHIFRDTRALFEYGFGQFKRVRADSDEERFGLSEESFFIKNKNMFTQSGSLFCISSDYITIPINMSLSDVSYKLSYIDSSQAGDDNVRALITYEMDGHYLGSAKLLYNMSVVQQEDGENKQEDNQQTIVTESEKEEVALDIRMIVAVVVTLFVLILVIRIWIRTKDRRRAKRERKKLFKKKLYK